MKYKKDEEAQKKYFDSIASHYIEDNIPGIDLLNRINKLIGKFIKGNILDIGSGGLISYNISQAKNITLTDLAGDLLKNPRILRKRFLEKIDKKTYPNIRFKECSALKLPFKSNSFDTVLMLDVAHHLSGKSSKDSQKNVTDALTEAHRVLRKGGAFLFVENCPGFLYNIVQILGYKIGYRLLLRFGRPLPYFHSLIWLEKTLNTLGFKTRLTKKLKWPKRVYQPYLDFMY